MRYPEFNSVLITGASSGIGEALALALAEPGRTLALTGRNGERLAAVAEACRSKGAEAILSALDVTDADGMRAFVIEADARAPLDLAVANAGISGGPGGGKEDLAQTAAIFAVNVGGVFNTVLPAADAMRARRRGRIAIVSSLAGFRGLPTAPAYSASKVAVRAWGNAIRPGLAKDGVGLSIVYPGFVESRITARNKFPMPFLMSGGKAADIILAGLAAGKRSIAFPWQTALMMRIFAALPGPLFDALMARAPAKE